MSTIITTPQAMQQYRSRLDNQLSIGFVPTMGCLHAGHKALLERARAENDIVIMSVFVNQTQFNCTQDYQNYPIQTEQDKQLAKDCNVDTIFMPTQTMMYPDEYTYQITETKQSQVREGQYRTGHFTGVLTIVMKLFQLICPTRAYFGEKDYQQLQVVKGLVNAFFLPIDIVMCHTVREASGLALSSRNQKLTPTARKKAEQFAQLLQSNLSCDAIKIALTKAGIDVDYLAEDNNRRFAAVNIDGVRLIDNIDLGETT